MSTVPKKIEPIENDDDFNTTEIPILLKEVPLQDTHPYFYLKWFRHNKRFRISISFKYLHKHWDLRVNIIRNLEKISEDNLKFIYELLKNGSAFRKINYKDKQNNLGFWHLVDSENSGEIFLFDRIYHGEKSSLLVFFSEKHWDMNSYLEVAKKANREDSK